MPNIAIITITFPDKEHEPVDRILHRLAGDLKLRFPLAREHNLHYGVKNQIVPQSVISKANIIYIVGHGTTNSDSVGGLPPAELTFSLLAGCVNTLKIDWIVSEIHLIACYGGAQPITGGKVFAKELRDRIVTYLSKYVSLPLKVIGYKGFVQDISPEGAAVVIPENKITEYETAFSEVKQEYIIEAEIKGVLAMVTVNKLDLNLVISTYGEYAPYRGLLAELIELNNQKDGAALVKGRIKKFAQDERRRCLQEVQAQYKLVAGKEKQTYAYDPVALAF
jgi:hypothetical protein